MHASDEPLASRAAWGLLWTGLLAYLVLSAPTLAMFGVPYALPGGALPAKIHPGTYLVTASLLLGLASRGNLLAQALVLMRRRVLVSLYLGCMVAVGLWSLWRHGAGGAAFFVDTLWMPGVALLAMALQPLARRRQLLWLIMAMLVLNAVIALVEQRMGRNMVSPFSGIEGVVEDDFFRASALLGHPLANALIVASLMPAVWLLPVAMPWRIAALGLLLLSMLAFGGRSSTAAVLVLYGGLLGVRLVQRALTRGFTYVQWLGGLLVAVLAVAAVVGVVALTGLGTRIFANLTWDNSANVRLVAWQALDHLDWIDWWIGVSPAQAELIATRIGLDLRYEAIENFWIAMLMQVGVLGFVPFVIGLACGVAHAWRLSGWPVRMGILLFFLVGSGANTLAAKTVALVLLFVTAQAGAAFGPRAAALPLRPLPRPHRPRAPFLNPPPAAPSRPAARTP